jgi:pimeloyl-ACP methyl ester carboxylesterase
VALGAAGCGSQNPTATLQGRLLTTTDLPAGWSAVATSPSTTRLMGTGCLSDLPACPKGLKYATVGFVDGVSIPTLGEVLASGPQVGRTWSSLDTALARCRTATLLVAGQKVKSTVRPLSLPRVGSSSTAYAWAFTLDGLRIGFDLVLFHAGGDAGYLVYSDLGSPSRKTVQAFADAAAAKAEGKTAHIPTALSVVWAPVRTIETTKGIVAYRSIGSGPVLMLIMGYGGTMEVWDRRLVDALAQHFRVLVFDNGGIGSTAALPAPLTIDAMADQTSALISALGLRQADVLGWSMGGMIAQALAVRHPAQVRRLILCATFPGVGRSVRPSQEAINALNSGLTKKVMADLFPADQKGAQNTYLAAVSSYPSSSPAPADIVTAQGQAIDIWWAGKDPAGRLIARIHVPTLVADGTGDRLDPLPNSHALARLIPGAKLKLYPDAGHAFLFQDEASFVQTVESFLR